MDNDLRDFEEFTRQREKASDAFINGEFGPLEEISAHALPATLFGPNGNSVVGADKVNAANASGAGLFEAGSTNRFEILHMAAADGIAYWVGFQRSRARMRGQNDPVLFNLRVTEIFRRENGAWKLIHRHADQLVSEP